MRVTHQKIADDLGVSRAAVTQALHGTRNSNLRPELRREVQRAARRLGYQPRNRTTHTIAYVMQMESIRLAGESRMLMLADQALREAGYRLMIASVHNDSVESLRETLNPKMVDGVLLTRWFGGKVKKLLSPEVPWVLTSDENGIGSHVNMVTVDTLQAAESLTRYLMGFGHERICLVTGSRGSGFHERQKAGVCTALAQAELPVTNLQMVEVRYDHEIAVQLRPILKSNAPPTAIIGASAEKTLTILNLLCHDGFRVPDDISVVSLVDSELLEPVIPPVTTTTFGDEAAKQAVQRLVELIEDPDSAPRQTLVPARMIERQSVAPVRKTSRAQRFINSK
jgi:DNA-binding LacI/PurR family transcriptional regulator